MLLQSLTYHGAGTHVVRHTEIEGEPWFVAQDACDVLGIKEAKSTLRNFPEDEKGVHSMHTPGGEQEMLIVNEPGLYRLIFTSRKPEAEAFRRWVFHDVLPSIRKFGTYPPPRRRPGLPENGPYRYYGVEWIPEKGKWWARYIYGPRAGDFHDLGLYDRQVDAAHAYDQHIRCYLGKEGRDLMNFPEVEIPKLANWRDSDGLDPVYDELTF